MDAKVNFLLYFKNLGEDGVTKISIQKPTKTYINVSKSGKNDAIPNTKLIITIKSIK